MKSHVDLKRFAFRLWPDKAAVERAMGLAKLTALVLRRQLDKTQQVESPLSQLFGMHLTTFQRTYTAYLHNQSQAYQFMNI